MLILFLKYAVEIVAVILVIVLFFFSITMHIVPNGYIWIIGKKGKPHKFITPGIRFIFPFINKIIDKIPTFEQTKEIYLSDVITKDNSIESFKIDYSFQIMDYSRYSYEFDLSEIIVNCLKDYVILVDKETLTYDNKILSDQIYSLVKEEIVANGFYLTKITIYHEI